MTKLAYLAGPYSENKPKWYNHHRDTLDTLTRNMPDWRIYSPIVVSHYWCMVKPHPYDFWIDIDLKWVRASDVVLRLEGPSPGADIEESEAKKHGIPVIGGTNAIYAFMIEHRTNQAHDQTAHLA